MLTINPKMLTICLIGVSLSLAGCIPSGPGAASQSANAQADNAMYKSISYANQAKQGPQLIVLPGEIKSNNATFLEKVSANNIADFGELELGKANFKVLERSDLGPMLSEISLAVGMGDKTALEKFKRGKMQSTKWFVKFDVLKAEPVAKASSSFDGNTLGSIFGTAVGGKGGAIGDTVISSAKKGDSAGVWLVGLRYKIVDASTSEQVSTNYFETKMEVGKQSQSFLGASGSAEQMITLDSIAQRLVQQAVEDIDLKK